MLNHHDTLLRTSSEACFKRELEPRVDGAGKRRPRPEGCRKKNAEMKRHRAVSAAEKSCKLPKVDRFGEVSPSPPVPRGGS